VPLSVIAGIGAGLLVVLGLIFIVIVYRFRRGPEAPVEVEENDMTDQTSVTEVGDEVEGSVYTNPLDDSAASSGFEDFSFASDGLDEVI
jgi:hypothetical protein